MTTNIVKIAELQLYSQKRKHAQTAVPSAVKERVSAEYAAVRWK